MKSSKSEVSQNLGKIEKKMADKEEPVSDIMQKCTMFDTRFTERSNRCLFLQDSILKSDNLDNKEISLIASLKSVLNSNSSYYILSNNIIGYYMMNRQPGRNDISNINAAFNSLVEKGYIKIIDKLKGNEFVFGCG